MNGIMIKISKRWWLGLRKILLEQKAKMELINFFDSKHPSHIQ